MVAGMTYMLLLSSECCQLTCIRDLSKKGQKGENVKLSVTICFLMSSLSVWGGENVCACVCVCVFSSMYGMRAALACVCTCAQPPRCMCETNGYI